MATPAGGGDGRKLRPPEGLAGRPLLPAGSAAARAALRLPVGRAHSPARGKPVPHSLRFASAPGSFPPLAGGFPRSVQRGGAAVVGQVSEVLAPRLCGPACFARRHNQDGGGGGAAAVAGCPGSRRCLWALSRAGGPGLRSPALRTGRGAGGRPGAPVLVLFSVPVSPGPAPWGLRDWSTWGVEREGL